MLTTSAMHLEVSQRHLTWYHLMLGMISHYFSIVTLSVKRIFFLDI